MLDLSIWFAEEVVGAGAYTGLIGVVLVGAADPVAAHVK